MPPGRRIRCMRNARGDDPAPVLPEDGGRALLEEYRATRNVLLVAPLVRHHLHLVNRVARRYLKLAGNDRIYKDLVGVGVLELLRCLRDYPPRDAAGFGAWAEPHVRRAMLHEVHAFNATRTVRDVWRALANVTFIRTCRNCIRRCVY